MKFQVTIKLDPFVIEAPDDMQETTETVREFYERTYPIFRVSVEEVDESVPTTPGVIS